MADEAPQSALPPVAIPAFNGPLDLLLHLIRKAKIDIYDLSDIQVSSSSISLVSGFPLEIVLTVGDKCRIHLRSAEQGRALRVED